MAQLLRLDEPLLRFRFNQALADPRDGLTLFGPLDNAKPYGIRWALIGPDESMARVERWVQRLQTPVCSKKPDLARPPFPGFEAVFGIPWPAKPVHRLAIPNAELRRNAFLDDPHQRVFNTVKLF